MSLFPIARENHFCLKKNTHKKHSENIIIAEKKMLITKRIAILLVTFTLFSSVYCQEEKTNPLLPILGSAGNGSSSDGSATGTGSNHYTEPAGDDSCAGCPGQLSSSSAADLSSALTKNGYVDARTDLNVRITIPKSENPYSTGDVDLWATVVRPGGSEKLPTIVVACPYRREIMMMLYLPLVGSRYNLMGVDIRGTGSSGGEWSSFDLIEQYDIKYVVDKFIPNQVWSDGKVGMIGPSYMAIIQMLTAGLIDTDPKTGEPVHLKALFPLVPMSDAYRDIVMHGGNCDELFIPMWLGMVDILAILPGMLNFGVDWKVTKENIDQAQAIWQEHWNQVPVNIGWIMDANNMNDGPFYDKKSPYIYWPVKPKGGWGFPEGNRVIPSKLPVFQVGGWFDIFTRGTTNIYQYGLSKHAVSDKKMIIGEYYHISGSMGMGLMSIMSGRLPGRWFDWKIKGKKDPFMDDFPVMLYVMGENKWRAEKSWPLPASRTDRKTLYLIKNAPSAIPGDWYTDDSSGKYADNNYALSETPDYSGDNPVLHHNPANLHGWTSRSSARWLMGMQTMTADLYKFFLNENIDANQWFDDERQDEKECLTFTTGPLADDTEIVGPVSVTFWAKTKFADPLTQTVLNTLFDQIKASLKITDNLILDSLNRKDVQWVADLTDVFPDGRARDVTSGWLAGWHRQYDPSGKTNVYWEGPWYNPKKVVEHPIDPAYVPFDPFYDGPDKNPVAINDGELYQYTVELWPTCNVFKKGNRIRISISASDFPHLLPFVQPSDNTLVIDASHQATLDFTTADRAGEGTTWNWIGDNGDADKYLMSDGPTGCGTPVVAASSSERGTTVGMAAELMGLLAIMILPMSVIMLQRHLRRRKKA
jgi:putative CocE/NonD family hydrolase